MRLRRRDDRVVLSGEVDFSSAELLAEALRRMSAPEPATTTTTVLDLTDLRFIDVSGCRALVTGTDELRRTGGRVTISGATGHIHKVMTLLGMDRIAAVELQ
jgi:anti-anti-sigma factor